MMQRTDWLIYGNGLSALVLAERLGSIGKQVVLVNPGKSWGGIFGGLNINGDVFDVGMTNFEFDLFSDPAEDIQNYDPDQKRDVGRYVHFVERYLSTFVEVLPVPTPCMRFGNHLVRDLILSNNFDVLKVLAPQARDAIRIELEAIVAAPNPLHPRTKNDPNAPLATATFAQASLANHGKAFHGLFIEPIFRKILGIPTTQIEAIFHRNGWAPLFYPETLLSQFGPAPQVLKPTIFRYPTDENFGLFIGRIAEKVSALPNVRLIESAKQVVIDAAEFTLRIDGEKLAFRHLAWGADPAQLLSLPHGAHPRAKRASLDIFFLRVRDEGVAHRFAVLIDSEVDSPFYRVTNQTICSGTPSMRHKIILECNSANWDETRPDKSAVIDAFLHRYGVDPAAVESCHRRSFTAALAIPSQAQRDEFNAQRQQILRSFPDIELIGPSSGYVSVTLNDQIIQALKIAQREGALE